MKVLLHSADRMGEHVYVNVVQPDKTPPFPHIAPLLLSVHERLWTEIPYYTVPLYTAILDCSEKQ
jgi:hypothetical protein